MTIELASRFILSRQSIFQLQSRKPMDTKKMPLEAGTSPVML